MYLIASTILESGSDSIHLRLLSVNSFIPWFAKTVLALFMCCCVLAWLAHSDFSEIMFFLENLNFWSNCNFLQVFMLLFLTFLHMQNYLHGKSNDKSILRKSVGIFFAYESTRNCFFLASCFLHHKHIPSLIPTSDCRHLTVLAMQ